MTLAGNADVTAADGLHSQIADLPVCLRCVKIRGVGVAALRSIALKHDLGGLDNR